MTDNAEISAIIANVRLLVKMQCFQRYLRMIQYTTGRRSANFFGHSLNEHLTVYTVVLSPIAVERQAVCNRSYDCPSKQLATATAYLSDAS